MHSSDVTEGEQLGGDEDLSFDLPEKRWAPVGAAASSPLMSSPASYSPVTLYRQPYAEQAAFCRSEFMSITAATCGLVDEREQQRLEAVAGEEAEAAIGSLEEEREHQRLGAEAAIRSLEEEREQLDASLLALTTHFARVQLRLRQVACCPDPDRKDALLRELEEFASNGVPDVSTLLPPPSKASSGDGCESADCNGGRKGLPVRSSSWYRAVSTANSLLQ